MTNRKFLFTAIYNRYVGMLGGALIMLSFLSGCATQRGAGSTTTTTIEKDSSDVKVEIRTEYVTDTLYIEIPAQKSSHSLENKAQKKPAEFQKPIEHKDSIRTIYKYRYKDKKVEVPVYVEKDLSWWQSTSIKFFPYALALILGMAGWIFRKPLIKIIKTLI